MNSSNVARLSALLESENFKSTQTATPDDLENKLFASLSSFLVTVQKISEVKYYFSDIQVGKEHFLWNILRIVIIISELLSDKIKLHNKT
mgnify:CR=1 FL=1